MLSVRNVLAGDLMKLTTFLKHIGTDDSGASAIEYGLIASLIVIAMLGALQGVAGVTDEMWNTVSDKSVEAMSR